MTIDKVPNGPQILKRFEEYFTNSSILKISEEKSQSLDPVIEELELENLVTFEESEQEEISDEKYFKENMKYLNLNS